MTNPLSMVGRIVRPRRETPVGRCPVCRTDVFERDGTVRLHGVFVHRGCASYRIRQRARLR